MLSPVALMSPGRFVFGLSEVIDFMLHPLGLSGLVVHHPPGGKSLYKGILVSYQKRFSLL